MSPARPGPWLLRALTALLACAAAGCPSSERCGAPLLELGERPRVTQLVAAGSTLYAVGGTPAEVWKTDGSREGTVQVASLGECQPTALAAMGDGLYLLCAQGGRSELWRHGGEAPVRVAELRGEPQYPQPVVVGGRLLFLTTEAEGTSHLWATEGTAEGTVLLHGFSPQSGVPRLVADGERAWVKDTSPGQAVRLWRSEGTVESTVPWAELPRSAVYLSGEVYALGGALLLVGQGEAQEGELWRSEGTGGTQLVAGFSPAHSPPRCVVGGSALYCMNQPRQGAPELWRSNGTPEGTVLVHRFEGAGDSQVRGLVAAEGSVLVALSQAPEAGSMGGWRPGVRVWMSSEQTRRTELLYEIGDEYYYHLGRAGSNGYLVTLRGPGGGERHVLRVLPLAPGAGCVR